MTTDLYGNTRYFFSLQVPHRELRVVADSVVVTEAPLKPPDDSASMTWEQARDLFRYKAGCAYDSASEFVFASPAAPRHQDFVDFSRSSLGAGRSCFDAAIDLMERIHTEFTYQSQSTEVDTTALAALSLKKGVCQDFRPYFDRLLKVLWLACTLCQRLPADGTPAWRTEADWQ